MFFAGSCRHLYLNSWEYNACRIIKKLEEIVENNGGRVKPVDGGTIQNRSLLEKIKEERGWVEQARATLKERPDAEVTKEFLREHEDALAKLEAIPNDPIEVSGSYINFVLDEFLCYFQIDDNPFFDHLYHKAKIRADGTYSKDACCEHAARDWMFDGLYRVDCAKDDITEAAYLIFNMLTSAEPTEIIRGKHRIRVSNTYNDGTHYETVLEPERLGKIDF